MRVVYLNLSQSLGIILGPQCCQRRGSWRWPWTFSSRLACSQRAVERLWNSIRPGTYAGCVFLLFFSGHHYHDLSCNYKTSFIYHILSSIIFCHIDTYSMYMHCQLTFSSWGDWLEPALHGKGATFAWSIPLKATSNQNTLFKNLLLDGFDGRIIHDHTCVNCHLNF